MDRLESHSNLAEDHHLVAGKEQQLGVLEVRHFQV